jgi:hypothetical protein
MESTFFIPKYYFWIFIFRSISEKSIELLPMKDAKDTELSEYDPHIHRNTEHPTKWDYFFIEIFLTLKKLKLIKYLILHKWKY